MPQAKFCEIWPPKGSFPFTKSHFVDVQTQFCHACGGLYESRSQINVASANTSESKLDTFRMYSNWELKETAYAANENRAVVKLKAVGVTSCNGDRIRLGRFISSTGIA